MKFNVLPLALGTLMLFGCGSGSSTPPGPTGDPGPSGGGGSGGAGPIGGGPDGGEDLEAVCGTVGGESLLSPSGSVARMPAIVADKDGFLVVWSDRRSGNGDLYGAKVDKAGKKSSEWVLVEGSEDSTAPSVAKVGSGYLLTWYDVTPVGADVKAMVLGADGKATGMAAMIAPTTTENPRPLVASAMGGAAVVWSDKKGASPTASVAWLNSSGQLTIPAVTLGTPTDGAQFPSVAASDDRIAVFYSDGRDGHLNIRATLFNDKLTSQTDVVVRDASNDAVNSRAIWDGEEFVAAWEDLRSDESEQVFASTVSESGTASAPVGVPEANEESNWPALASTPGGVAIAYYQFRKGTPQIMMAYMAKSGSFVRPDVQVSQTTGKARFPAVASDGGSTLGVVWEDSRSGHQEVYFARVTCP